MSSDSLELRVAGREEVPTESFGLPLLHLEFFSDFSWEFCRPPILRWQEQGPAVLSTSTTPLPPSVLFHQDRVDLFSTAFPSAISFADPIELTSGFLGFFYSFVDTLSR